MSLLATRNAVGLLMRTLGFTNTGELTADSLTVKFPNCTAPRSNSICANHRLSRDCSFIKNRGMETRLRSRDGRKCRRSFLVPIAITAMDGRTRAMADALYHPVCRRDIK